MNFRYFCLIFIISSSYVAIAQPKPFLQRALGGYGQENAVGFTQTFDKGYVILSDNANSSGGDIIDDNITGIFGELYSWVVKVDSAQNILWRYNIHRNTIPELRVRPLPKDIIQTKDSGIVVIGESYATYSDSTTAWAIKFNKKGKLLWKYILPISYYIYYSFSEIKEAQDGSLIIAGTKNPNRVSVAPITMGWIVVLNSNGTLKWERNYLHNRSYFSLGFKTIDVLGDGFLIGGNKDDSFGMIRPDFYLFKTNFNGDSLWSKTYGGYGEEKLQDVLPLPDGYLVIGTANYNDHDVTGIHCVNGASSCLEDAWLLKLDNAGTIIWQKAIGDVNRDIAGKLVQSNNGYFIVGSSTSDQYTPTKTKGGYDAWSMEFDKNGSVISNRVFYGGPRDDFGVSILWDSSGGKSYPVILSTTKSETGDVEGFHDVVGQSGESDAWIFKLGYFNTISGTIFYDLNKNGVKETIEPFFKRGILTFATSSDSILTYNTTGQYSIKLEGASYKVGYTLGDSAFEIVPASRTIQLPGFFTTQTADFALQLRPGISDISVSAIGVSRARPGFQATYEVLLFNRSGDTVRNQEFYFIKDSRTNFSSSSPAYSGIKGDTMVLKYTNLKYSDTLRYTIVLNIPAPPVVAINDTLSHYISAPLLKDVDTLNNYVTLKQLVRGSFDPNDKSETHEGIITPSQASKGEYMNYLIRFQNTGTDTAITVIVRDSLDKTLDLPSFEMIKASHPYTISIKNNVVEWRFANINLPDSNINEKASHGYIAYKIKTLKNLAVNSSINNSAGIYFDYNLPVRTNTAKTLISDNKSGVVTGINEPPQIEARIFPNPVSQTFFIEVKANESIQERFARLYNANGILFRMDIKQVGNNLYSINVKRLLNGIYWMQVNGKNGVIRKKIMVLK